MPKFFGKVGYADDKETSPGVWTKEIVEIEYYGDLIRNTRKLQSADKVNDNIDIANDISIIADPYAHDHFHLMQYVELFGTKWKITNVEVQYPRLILTVGGVWNGESV